MKLNLTAVTATLILLAAINSSAADNRLMKALLAADNSTHGRYFMVMTSGVASNDGLWTGSLAGLSGANAKCLSDLTKYDWFGKSRIISLNSQTVKAFLCDGTSCQEPLASTGYVFARANSTASGGASLYTNGSGIGPTVDWDAQIDTIAWSAGLYFGVSASWWSGRGLGTDPAWSTTSGANHCTTWSSSSGAVSSV